MEEIEYLEEYEDLVLPALNSAAAAAASSTSQIPAITNPKTITNDDEDASSSSLDQDIFNCLFEDNSDDEKSEDNDKSLNQKSESRTSVDSLDLLVHDLDEQVAKEIALKNAQREQNNKINTSLQAASKITLSTPNPKTFMSKSSGTTIPLNRITSTTTTTTKSITPTTSTNKKFIATVRPTVQYHQQQQHQQQQQQKKNTNIIQKSSFTQQQQKSSSFTGTTASSSVKPTTTRSIQLPVLARKPLTSALSSSTLSAGTTLVGQKLASNQAIKPAVIKRPATIVKPEKVITKDPTEDPLNLDDLSEAASDNYSVSDISGDTYNSISNFDDDDDDDDEDDYLNEEQLHEDDDFSSNSQIIEISIDSSGSHSNLEVLRASTPSPIMSRDKPSSSSGFDKWKYQSTKLFANHNIVRGLLTRGEKPKLLDLIKKYDTHRDSSDEEDNEIIDVTNSRENLTETKATTKAHVYIKDTNKKSSSHKNPTPSNKDNCKTNMISVTARTQNDRRDTKSPGATSNDSYLSAVEELLEESYAEAMKKIKQSGTSLHNQEVGAEMEIGDDVEAVVKECQADKPKTTQTGIVIEYEDNLLENNEEELKEKKSEELGNNPEEIKEPLTELNKPKEIKETITELTKPEETEANITEIKNTATEEKNIHNPAEIEKHAEIIENLTESNKIETEEEITLEKVKTIDTESTEKTRDKTLEQIPNALENDLVSQTKDITYTDHESKNATKLCDNLKSPVNQSPFQRKKKRFRNLISPEPTQNVEVTATKIHEDISEDVGDFKGFEDEATTLNSIAQNEAYVIEDTNKTEIIEKEKSSDKETSKVTSSTTDSFKSPSSTKKTSLDKHKDTKDKRSRDSSMDSKDKSSRDTKDRSSKDGDKSNKSSRESSKDRTFRENSKDRSNRSASDTKSPHAKHTSHSKHTKGAKESSSKHHSHHKDYRKSIDSKESSRSRESSKSRDPKETKKKIDLKDNLNQESKTTEENPDKKENKKIDLHTAKQNKSSKDLKTSIDKESKDKLAINKTKDENPEPKDHGVKTTTTSTTNETKHLKYKKDSQYTRDLSKERKDASKYKDLPDAHKTTKDPKDSHASPSSRESAKDHKDSNKQIQNVQTTPTNKIDSKESNKPSTLKNVGINNNTIINKDSKVFEKSKELLKSAQGAHQKVSHKSKEPKDIEGDIKDSVDKTITPSKLSSHTLTTTSNTPKEIKPMATKISHKHNKIETPLSPTKDSKDKTVLQEQHKTEKIKHTNATVKAEPTKNLKTKESLSPKVKDTNSIKTKAHETESKDLRTEKVNVTKSITLSKDTKDTITKSEKSSTEKKLAHIKIKRTGNIKPIENPKSLDNKKTRETNSETEKNINQELNKNVKLEPTKSKEVVNAEHLSNDVSKTKIAENKGDTIKSNDSESIKSREPQIIKKETRKDEKRKIKLKRGHSKTPEIKNQEIKKVNSDEITTNQPSTQQQQQQEIILHESKDTKLEKDVEKNVELKQIIVPDPNFQKSTNAKDTQVEETITPEPLQVTQDTEIKEATPENESLANKTTKGITQKSDESEKISDGDDETKKLKPEPRRTRHRDNLKAQEHKSKELAENKEEESLNKTSGDLISYDLMSKEPTRLNETDETSVVTESDECEKTMNVTEANKPEPMITRNRDNLKTQEHKSKELTTRLTQNKEEEEALNDTSGDLICDDVLSKETSKPNQADEINVATKSDESEKTSDETEAIKPEPMRTRNRDNSKTQEHKSKERTTGLAENKESLNETVNTKTSNDDLTSDALISNKPTLSNELKETNVEVITANNEEKNTDFVKSINSVDNKTEGIKAVEMDKEPKQTEQTESTSSVQLKTQETKGETYKNSQISTPEEKVTNPENITQCEIDNKELENLENKEDKTQEINESNKFKDNTETSLIIISNLDNTLATENNILASVLSPSTTDTTFRRSLRKRGTESPFFENDNNKKIFKDHFPKPSMGTPKSTKSETPVADVLSPSSKRSLRLPASEAETQTLAKKPKLDAPARKSARFRNFNDDCLDKEELPIATADESEFNEISAHVQEAAQTSRKSIRRTNVEQVKEPPTETNNTQIVVNTEKPKDLTESSLNPNNNKSMEIEQPPRKLLRKEDWIETTKQETVISTNQSSTAEPILVAKLNISGRKVPRPEDAKTAKDLQKPVSNHKSKTVSTTNENPKIHDSPDKSKTSKVTTSHNKSPGFSAVLSFSDWLKNKNQYKNIAQQQTTGTHLVSKDEQTRRIRARETKSSTTGNDMMPPVTIENESREVVNIKQQETQLPVESVETELHHETIPERSDNTISGDIISDNINKSASTEKDETQTVSKEDGHSLLGDNNILLQPTEDQLNKLNTITPLNPRRTVKRHKRSDRNVRKQPKTIQKPIQEDPKQTITDYQAVDEINTLVTHSEMPSKIEKTNHTPKHKNKKSEIDLLIESMSKEMKEGGIQDLLNVDTHVKRQRLASKKRATASTEHLNATANVSFPSSVETSMASDTSLLKGTPSAIGISDKIETPSINDNITKSPAKRQAAQHNVGKTRKSLPARDALRKDIFSELAQTEQLANNSPLRDGAQNNNSTKYLRKSFMTKEKEIPNELQFSEKINLQIPPVVVATKRRKSPLTKESTMKEVIAVAGEIARDIVGHEAKPVKAGNVSRKSVKHLINEQQQQQLPLNKNNRYINKVNTNVFKTPKPITHSTILNRIPAIDDITQLYAIKSPHSSQKSKQQPTTPMMPSLKCRKLRVRLNRSLVKEYWKNLRQKQPLSSAITTLTEVTEKAVGTVDIIQNNTETNLRIHSVVSRANLLSSPTLISSEELPETPALTSQPFEGAPTIPESLPTAIEDQPYLLPTSDNAMASTIPIATPLDTGLPVELKNEFMDENPISLENTVLPDTPTLLARAQSVTQAAQHALSNSVIPTDIRLLTTEAASSTYVPSFGVTPTQLDNRGTCMYTFLHPAKYNRNHSNVLLDYCCPNLDGPMPAIDPTRIHAQVQTRVIELPSCIVLTTKVVTRADLESNKSSVPAIIRKKAERIRINIAAHHNVSSAPTSLTQSLPPTQPTPQLPVVPVMPPIPPVPPQQLSSTINALARHLPPTTTITPKIRPTQPQSSVGQVPPTALMLPKGLPQYGNMLKNYVQPLRSNLRRFDVLLKQLVKPFDSLTFVDRHRIIESIISSGKLSPRDLERTLVLMEEYLTQISFLQTQQTVNISVSSYSTPPDEAATSLPMQMPQLQPAPNILAASTSSSTFSTATKQLENLQNTSDRKVQTTKKNTSLTTTRRARGAGAVGEVNQHHVPIYDTERNVIGYQLQMVAPLSTMPAYTKSTMSSRTGSGIMSTSLENQISSYSIRKRPPQDSPRVFYTTPPLKTSTPKAPNYSNIYTTNPLNSKAVAQKTQGSVVTLRSGGSTPSGSSETITTTTMATVKRVTRSTATGSKIIIVSKSNQSSEETILPDGNNQQAAEIKNENDMEDFIG